EETVAKFCNDTAAQNFDTCAMIVIDPLNDSMFGSGCDSKVMSRFVAGLDKVQRRMRCAVLLIQNSFNDGTSLYEPPVIPGPVDFLLRFSLYFSPTRGSGTVAVGHDCNTADIRVLKPENILEPEAVDDMFFSFDEIVLGL